jgi:hypothetical protein
MIANGLRCYKRPTIQINLQVDLEVINANWNKVVNLTVKGVWDGGRCVRYMSFDETCKRDFTSKAVNKSLIRRLIQSITVLLHFC